MTQITASLEREIQQALDVYRQVMPHRHNLLFTHFLPLGYQFTTLSSVAREYMVDVLMAKQHLGMLITLLDDFADNPRFYNSRLLYELYKIPFNSHCSNRSLLNEDENKVFDLSNYLANKIIEYISHLPHYKNLQAVLRFDQCCIYQSNNYSALMTHQPDMLNSQELTRYRPFNMGMVMAGMIDLMASSSFINNELGRIRHILHLGQRCGSISNNITTLQRELAEGDVTNEIIVKALERNLLKSEDLSLSIPAQLSILNPVIDEMKLEQLAIYQQIYALSLSIKTFDTAQYVQGLQQLHSLHESMQGTI